jgi:hydroxypyruvate isomerase
MNDIARRTFVATGLAAAASATAARRTAGQPAQRGFQLAYAPPLGMFRASGGGDVIGELEFIADQGFKAFEDNNMTRRSVEEREAIARAAERLGLQMGVFVANFGTAFGKKSFVTGDPEMLENFLADLRASVEVAKRVNAKWTTIVLGDLEPRLEMDYQTANAIDMLRRGAEVYEPHDLVMVMEPLNPFANHPGMFLSGGPQAYMLCRAVNSPACKILFDIYHQQITEGNLIANIDRCWSEIGYFQIGDNPGRREPGTGEINYLNVFKHIAGKGYDGILGMEHGKSRGGEAGEQAVIEAYRACDSFSL